MLTQRLGHVPALDGLRGIAIILVVGFHNFGLRGGFYGVDLFFVLSGFLITTLLLEELDRDGRVKLRRFYERRARRLLPAVGFMLAVFLMIATLRHANGLRIVLEGGLYDANVAQAFFHPGLLAGHGIEHLWSLAEEEQFYAVWPVLLVAVARTQRPIRLLAITAGLLVAYRAGLLLTGAASPDRVYYGIDTHADGLVVGCMLAFGRRSGYRPQLRLALAAIVTASACAVWVQGIYGQAITLPLVELAAAAAIGIATSNTLPSRLLSRRPLVFVGKISYSLYLWHFVVPWMFGVTGIVALLFAVPLSLFSYWCIEQPFRRRRSARLERAESPSAAIPETV